MHQSQMVVPSTLADAIMADAIEAWQQVLGPRFVDIDDASLTRIATATFPTSARVPAILRPSTREEVQECVRIANRFKIPIYPVSTGKNWGYGSSAPIEDRCVVMHLGRMNKILDLDPQKATVSIQPGVTQGQLAEFLLASGSDVWADVTGSSAGCSVIGNIMERGIGHSAYGNRVSYICCMEVVLPNGEWIETGFGKYDNAQAKHVYPWGLGPSLDGLFTESNLGIVTRLTLWLMPKPEAFECFYFSARGHEGLREVVDALQPLRLRRVIESSVHIGNNYKMLNVHGQYPWRQAGGQTPLQRELLSSLSASLGCEDWSGSGALYGTKGQVREAKRMLRRALDGKAKQLRFMNDRTISIIKRFPRLLGAVTGIHLESFVPTLESVYGMQKGIPSDVTMRSAYWRKKQAPPESMDPDRDRCGLLWYSPVAPLSGHHAMSIHRIVEELTAKFSFEPLISFVFMSERAMCAVISIVYDREVAGEDEKAMACHDAIVSELAASGYYSYRLGIQSMSKLPPHHDSYRELIKTIKRSLDPNRVISPGRYEF